MSDLTPETLRDTVKGQWVRHNLPKDVLAHADAWEEQVRELEQENADLNERIDHLYRHPTGCRCRECYVGV